jgi:putative transposase
VIIESESKEIIGITLSKERNMFIAERFISGLIQIHDLHPVSRDGVLGIPRPVDS